MQNGDATVLSNFVGRGAWASVTVVVPARNEERFIARCLDSLASQDYPIELTKVVIVDNGSVDRTVEIARSFGVSVISRPDRLVGAVRNAGVEGSKTDVVAFLDADCVAGRYWLRAAVDVLANEQVGVVGGRYVPNPRGTWVERAWKTARIPPSRQVQALPGGSMVFRRDIFDAVGGFNEVLSAGEDDDICRKVRVAGRLVIAVPECYVVHLGYPSDLVSLARRQIWHGSHQLDVAESLIEPQLVLTHMTLVGVIGVGLGTLTMSGALLAGAIGLCLVGPLVLAVRRAKGRKQYLVCFLQLVLIGVFFYTGRSIGLLKNYMRRSMW